MCVRCRKEAEQVPSGEANDVLKDLLARGERYQQMNIWELKQVAKEDGEDEGGEEFLPEELILAAIIGTAFYEVGKDPAKTLVSMIKDGGVAALDDAIAAVDQDFAEAFSHPGTEKKVRQQLKILLGKGSAIGGNGKEIFRLSQTKEILEDMVASTKYFTNHYFNDHVVPDLKTIVEKIIYAGVNVDTEAYEAIREAMSQRLKSVPYWRLVANAAASRGFHYGAIKAGLTQGYRAYKIVAVLDDRTSEICKHMNNKEFWVADAELQVVRSALAQGDEIKYVAPWLKENQIIGKSADELREMGFIVPPFHGHCRSTIRFIA